MKGCFLKFLVYLLKTSTLRNKKGFEKFLKNCGKLDDMNIKNMDKKALRRGYQLLFNLVNKALLPCTENKSIVECLDLFLMEALSKFQKVNLFVIVIEQINTVTTTNYGKHRLAYGFWLNRIFAYFNVECGSGNVSSIK